MSDEKTIDLGDDTGFVTVRFPGGVTIDVDPWEELHDMESRFPEGSDGDFVKIIREHLEGKHGVSVGSKVALAYHQQLIASWSEQKKSTEGKLGSPTTSASTPEPSAASR